MFFNHCWRVMIEKKEFIDPGVPVFQAQVETVKSEKKNVMKMKKKKVEKAKVEEKKVDLKGEDEGGESEKSDEEGKEGEKKEEAEPGKSTPQSELKKLEPVHEVTENDSDDLS